MPKTKLVKLGNSLAVRIPRAVVAQAGLLEGDSISIKVLDARIELHRLEGILTLEELVAQITPENRYEETEWGPDRGKEIIER
jgi:antitoxin MazE